MVLSTMAKWGGLAVVVVVVITVTTIIIKIKRERAFIIVISQSSTQNHLDFMKWHYQLRLNGEA